MVYLSVINVIIQLVSTPHICFLEHKNKTYWIVDPKADGTNAKCQEKKAKTRLSLIWKFYVFGMISNVRLIQFVQKH